MKTALVAAAAVVTAGVLGAAMLGTGTFTKTRSSPPADNVLASTNPPVVVALAAPRVRTFEVTVPPTDNPSLATPYQVTVDDSVVFVVTSTRPGMITVHGLSDDVDVGPSTVARLTVTPHTTGRFPLHFHGNDGAHFAISAIDVYPKE